MSSNSSEIESGESMNSEEKLNKYMEELAANDNVAQYDTGVVNPGKQKGVKARSPAGKDYVLGAGVSVKVKSEIIFPKLPKKVLKLDEISDAEFAEDLIKILKDHEDPEIKSLLWRSIHSGNSPLHVAIMKGYEDIAELLIPHYPFEAFLLPNAQGNTVVHLAGFLRMGNVLHAMITHVRDELDGGKQSKWAECVNQINWIRDEKGNLNPNKPIDCYEAAEEYQEEYNVIASVKVTKKNKKETNRAFRKHCEKYKEFLKKTMNVKATKNGELSRVKVLQDVEVSENGEVSSTKVLRNIEWKPMDAVLLNPVDIVAQFADEKVARDRADEAGKVARNRADEAGKVARNRADEAGKVARNRAEKADRDLVSNLLTNTDEVQLSKDCIALVKSYILNKYDGNDKPFMYHAIVTHFTKSDDLLSQTKEFVNVLDQAFTTAVYDLGVNELSDDNVGQLSEVANDLKANVYKAILKKQEALRDQRKQTAKKLSVLGLLLPGISHLFILLWYRHHLRNEPLRSEILRENLKENNVTAVYGDKHKGSVKDILDALSKKEPISLKPEYTEARAHRAVILVENSVNTAEDSDEISDASIDSGSESQSIEEEENSDEGSQKVDLFTTVQIISTTWNGQSKIFKEKCSKAQNSSSKNDKDGKDSNDHEKAEIKAESEDVSDYESGSISVSLSS